MDCIYCIIYGTMFEPLKLAKTKNEKNVFYHGKLTICAKNFTTKNIDKKYIKFFIKKEALSPLSLKALTSEFEKKYQRVVGYGNIFPEVALYEKEGKKIYYVDYKCFLNSLVLEYALRPYEKEIKNDYIDTGEYESTQQQPLYEVIQGQGDGAKIMEPNAANHLDQGNTFNQEVYDDGNVPF